MISRIPHLGDIEQLDSLGLRQIKYLLFDNHHLAVHHKAGSRVQAGQVYPATEHTAGPGTLVVGLGFRYSKMRRQVHCGNPATPGAQPSVRTWGTRKAGGKARLKAWGTPPGGRSPSSDVWGNPATPGGASPPVRAWYPCCPCGAK